MCSRCRRHGNRMDSRFRGNDGHQESRFRGSDGWVGSRYHRHGNRMDSRFRGNDGHQESRFRGNDGHQNRGFRRNDGLARYRFRQTAARRRPLAPPAPRRSPGAAPSPTNPPPVSGPYRRAGSPDGPLRLQWCAACSGPAPAFPPGRRPCRPPAPARTPLGGRPGTLGGTRLCGPARLAPGSCSACYRAGGAACPPFVARSAGRFRAHTAGSGARRCGQRAGASSRRLP